MVLQNFRGIDKAVSELIRPETLARYRASAAALENRAVFEIPDMLERIFDQPMGQDMDRSAQGTERTGDDPALIFRAT